MVYYNSCYISYTVLYYIIILVKIVLSNNYNNKPIIFIYLNISGLLSFILWDKVV